MTRDLIRGCWFESDDEGHDLGLGSLDTLKDSPPTLRPVDAEEVPGPEEFALSHSARFRIEVAAVGASAGCRLVHGESDLFRVW